MLINSGFSWYFGGVLGALFCTFPLLNITKQRLVKYLSIQPNLPGSPSFFTDKHDLRESFQFILPLVLTSVPSWWLTSGYRLLIDLSWSPESMAILAVGLSLSTSIFRLIEAIVFQFTQPILNKKIAGIKVNAVKIISSCYVNTIGPAYIIFASWLFGSSPIIFQYLVDKQYNNSMFFVSIGILRNFAGSL